MIISENRKYDATDKDRHSFQMFRTNLTLVLLLWNGRGGTLRSQFI